MVKLQRGLISFYPATLTPLATPYFHETITQIKPCSSACEILKTSEGVQHPVSHPHAAPSTSSRDSHAQRRILLHHEAALAMNAELIILLRAFSEMTPPPGRTSLVCGGIVGERERERERQ